jgi:hypothetical protein
MVRHDTSVKSFLEMDFDPMRFTELSVPGVYFSMGER